MLAGLAPLCALGQAPVSQLPDGPNREIVQRFCSGCHSVQMFLGRGMTREQWGSVVTNMIGRGASISAVEFEQVVDYPGKTVPPWQAEYELMPVLPWGSLRPKMEAQVF